MTTTRRTILKKDRFSSPTDTERDVAYLLSNVSDAAVDSVGSIEPIVLARIKVDPLQPRETGLNPESPEDIDDTSPDAPRRRVELQEIRQLAESIKAHGLIQEPSVYRHGDNYFLVQGERRLLACRLLKHETIYVKILPERPKDLRAKQLVENIQRRDLTLFERMRGIKAMRDEAGSALGVEDLARLLGVSETSAYRYHSLMSAPADVMGAIADGRLTDIKTAYSIAVIEDADERSLALTQLDQRHEQTETEPPAPAKPAVVNKVRTRGRPATSVSLPKTSGAVARLIAEKLVPTKEFEKLYAGADWSDLKVATDLVKQIIKKLEQQLSKAN